MESKALLELKDVSIGYKTDTGVVRAGVDINLTVHEGRTLGIVGESGSGKSTLAHGILGLLPSSAQVSGEILLNGENLLTVSEARFNEIRWIDMAVVFQKSMNSFSPVHRIGTQIIDIYRVHKPKATKQEIFDRMNEILKVVNLPPRVLGMYPHQFSGGMLQRLCIAISLMYKPKLVFFDEATTALDVVIQGQVLREIRRLEETQKMTGILITHDVSVVAETCVDVAVMYAGYVMEFGRVSDVLVRPKHPYTQQLLASFPTLTGEKKPLRGIAGALPDLKLEHHGCIFAPRCESAKPDCFTTVPDTVSIGEGHQVRCLIYSDISSPNSVISEVSR